MIDCADVRALHTILHLGGNSRGDEFDLRSAQVAAAVQHCANGDGRHRRADGSSVRHDRPEAANQKIMNRRAPFLDSIAVRARREFFRKSFDHFAQFHLRIDSPL